VDNIKTALREIGWEGMDWIDLAQNMDQWKALVNMVMNLLVPQNTGKFLSGCTIGGFSRMAQLREWNETLIQPCFVSEGQSACVNVYSIYQKDHEGR
jgi:hypothetical protein